MATTDTSAKGIIDTFLALYGLQSLGDWAWNKFTGADGGPGATVEEIRLELPKQQAFKDRFPAYEQLAQQGQAMSPDEMVAYEKRAAGLLQQYGVPNGMYDTPAAYAKLMVNRVSTIEMEQRLGLAADAALRAPESVRSALKTRYGVSEADLVGFYLDPEKALPLIQRNYTAAQIASAAEDAKISMETQLAERLAGQGVDYRQAIAGMSAVKSQQDLTSNLIGDQGLNTDTLIGAQFGDAAAGAAVEKKARQRAATNQDNNQSVSATQRGVSGLDSANR